VLAGAFAAAQLPIGDPEAFVRDVYHRYTATRSNYVPPDNIYTPRLKGLIDEDKRRANGEVGCIDFDFWLNAQDWSVKNVRVASQNVAGHADRRTVKAEFSNPKPQEIHFDFLLVKGAWLLDDVESFQEPRWKLSELLSCWKR
jgi:hypothetical protein